MHAQHPTATSRRDAYLATPIGAEAGEYLRHKSKRLTDASQRSYSAALRWFALDHPDLTPADLEPPDGTRIIEDFLAARWGDKNPKTYNIQLTVLTNFCKWMVLRGRIHGDPTLPIERAKPRPFHRSTFTPVQRQAILDTTRDTRYRIAVKLLLDYGIRKGALAGVRFEHFDPARSRLVIFTKGGRIHELPIPDPSIWDGIAQLQEEPGAQPSDYLLCAQVVRTRRRSAAPLVETLLAQTAAAAATARALGSFSTEGSAPLIEAKFAAATELLGRQVIVGETIHRRDREKPLGIHGLHDWWYRRLEVAGIVAPGVTRGQRMHKARHTAAQRVLDIGGNLKEAQELLGHASSATTDAYTGWGGDKLADTLRESIRVG